MKYIGQYVYDLIARFRGDVYINSDLYLQQTHTVITGGYEGGLNSQDRILYLDPNSTGKVVHSADFEYDTVNEKLTIGDEDNGYAYVVRRPRIAGQSNVAGGSFSLHAGQGTGSATGGLIELGTSAAGSSGTSLNDITEKLILWPNVDVSGFAGSGTAGGHNSDFVQVTMPGGLGVYTDTNPKVVLGPRTTTASSSDLGVIEWHGMNTNSELIDFVMIRGGVSDNADGDEAGSLSIRVAASTGSFSSLKTGLQVNGSNTDNDVDIVLGSHSTSTTTINGFLSLGGHTINDIDIAGEFVDSDEHIMTSAAIDDRINTAIATTVGGDVDLTSEVSGILPVANGGTGASSLTDNSILTGTGTSAITAEANLTWDGSMLTVFSDGDANEPVIKIHARDDTLPLTGGELRFDSDRGDTGLGNANDVLGTITWRGHDDQSGGQATESTFASIVGTATDANNNSEDGKLEFNVLNQGTINSGLSLAATGFNGHVNATVGKGTVGVVTIEGYLNLGGHNVNDIDITSEASDADDHLMTALAIKNRIEDYNYVTAAVTLTTAAQTNITSLGTLTALDVDNINLNGKVVTITGDTDDTFTIETGADGATTLTTVDTAGTAGHFEVAADGNITLDSAGDIVLESQTSTLTWSSTGDLDLVSDSTGDPTIRLTSTAGSAHIGGELSFVTDEGAAGASGDVLGRITFIGDNADQDTPQQTYAKIQGKVDVATDGEESGILELQVANHDDDLGTGLTLTGGSQNDEIDVTIGLGSASTTTVAGDLSVTTGLILDSVDITAIQTAAELSSPGFQDNDTSLLTAAAIDDRINAASGGSVSVSDSTANTNFPVVFHDESNNLHDDTGAFTYNPSTGTANIPIASIPKRKFTVPAGDTAGNADGDVVYIGTGSTVTGKIYYYKSDGSWGLTNSDDPSTATGWLAVALGTDPDVDGMLIRGTVDLEEDIVGTEALGSIIYLDKATAGAATTAAPTATGDIVRVIGYALDTGNENKIWFSPDNTWVEHV